MDFDRMTAKLNNVEKCVIGPAGDGLMGACQKKGRVPKGFKAMRSSFFCCTTTGSMRHYRCYDRRGIPFRPTLGPLPQGICHSTRAGAFSLVSKCLAPIKNDNASPPQSAGVDGINAILSTESLRRIPKNSGKENVVIKLHTKTPSVCICVNTLDYILENGNPISEETEKNKTSCIEKDTEALCEKQKNSTPHKTGQNIRTNIRLGTTPIGLEKLPLAEASTRRQSTSGRDGICMEVVATCADKRQPPRIMSFLWHAEEVIGRQTFDLFANLVTQEKALGHWAS